MFIVCPKCKSETAVTQPTEQATCSRCGLAIFLSTWHPPAGKDIGHPPADADAAANPERARPGEEPTAETETVAIPLNLGNYQILRILGEGGFGRVYLASEPELNRQVAIKIPRADRFRSDAALAGLLQEARTIASLEHPNIVKVYRIDRDSTGLDYIVMQYLEGGSLDTRIRSERIPLRAGVEMLRKVALAIHHAHRRQYFHRDLKPNNILLDANGEPYVADFGLAVREDLQARHAGEFAGTLHYMAPEQIRREVQWLDGRTDVWSLGVILYRLLTGRLPFQGDRQLLPEEILNRPPRPPRQIDESIPHALEDACLRCLRKPVAERYASAFDLAEDLGKWLRTSEPTASLSPQVPAPPVAAAPERASEPAGRGKAWALLGLGLLVLAGLFGPGLWLLSISGERRERLPLRTNWELDQFVPPGRWYPLLDQTPRELVFPRYWNTARWLYNPDVQEVLLDHPDIGLLEVGQTAAEDFQLQVTIAKSAWAGNSGLFWGHQERNAGSGETECEVLTVVAFPGLQGTETWVHFGHFTFTPSALVARPDIYRAMLTSEQVVLPPLVDNVLQVRVRRGRMISAEFRGVRLNKIIQDAAAAPVSPTTGAGRFGVIGEQGSTVFRDVRFRLENQGTRHGQVSQ